MIDYSSCSEEELWKYIAVELNFKSIEDWCNAERQIDCYKEFINLVKNK